MPVIRVDKNKNYTIMSNHHLRDKSLSLKAKGIMSFMLSLPDDWDYTVAGLSKCSKDGIEGVRAALRELEKKRYLVIEQNRTGGKFSNTEYVLTEKPFTEKPLSVEPLSEKPIQISTNVISTNLTSTKELSLDKITADVSDYQFLSDELVKLILSNNKKARIPTSFIKWNTDFRYMIKRDNRSVDEIRSVMVFSQEDQFWKANILSPKKLREKFDTLFLQKGRSNGGIRNNTSKITADLPEGERDWGFQRTSK